MITLLNNDFLDEKAARITTADRGFTLGDGVFDTLLCIDGKPQYAREHFTRLLGHAGALRISIARTPETLEQNAMAILKKNRITKGRYALRTTITRGPGDRGLAPPETVAPTLFMRLSPVPAETPPVNAAVAYSTRRNEFSPLSLIKSLNYGDNLLALLEAQEKGANEAIVLNTAGHAVCASTSNIFILEEGRVLTPPLTDGVMDGITRALVMAQTGAVEQSLTVARLHAAEGIYLTNSIMGVRAVESIDGITVDSRNMLYDELLRNLSLPAAA